MLVCIVDTYMAHVSGFMYKEDMQSGMDLAQTCFCFLIYLIRFYRAE